MSQRDFKTQGFKFNKASTPIQKNLKFSKNLLYDDGKNSSSHEMKSNKSKIEKKLVYDDGKISSSHERKSEKKGGDSSDEDDPAKKLPIEIRDE